MLKTSFLPKAESLSALSTAAPFPKRKADADRQVVAHFSPKPTPPYVSLRIHLAPETTERFVKSVTELAPALDIIRGKEPYTAGSVLAMVLLDASHKTDPSEKAKLQMFREAVHSRWCDSVYVSGLPAGETEAAGEKYDMRRAALLGLAFSVDLTPSVGAVQKDGQTLRFDRMTTPVLPEPASLSVLSEKPLVLPNGRRQLTFADPAPTFLRSEGAAELIPPPVVMLAGTQANEGADVRLTPFSDLVRTLDPQEKRDVFKPLYVFKGRDAAGEETAMALPLAIPAPRMMSAEEFFRKLAFERRGDWKDPNMAATLAACIEHSDFRLDARAGMVKGLTTGADRTLDKWRDAARVKGEEAPALTLNAGEALFVNNYKMLHRADGETGPKRAALLEKMSLEHFKRPSSVSRS